ncbi:hypothetical protein HGG75_28735 [Ochrobactrum pseudogrignonense]|nr:hypothetical protein [Brucella pseudogrignonensis]
MGIVSEIEIPAERAGLRAERESTAADNVGDRQQRRNSFEGLKLGARGAERLQQDSTGESGSPVEQKRPQQAQKQRGGMFSDLRLNARSGSSKQREELPGRGDELAVGASTRPPRY